MSGVRTVYAVTHGQWSDYYVECLFETKELAEQYSDRMGGEVEEFQMWSVLPVIQTNELGHEIAVEPKP